MSVQDLLQKDVKQVVGPNIRLAVSSLPSDYTVEVRKCQLDCYPIENSFVLLETDWTIAYNEGLRRVFSQQ